MPYSPSNVNILSKQSITAFRRSSNLPGMKIDEFYPGVVSGSLARH